jgi:hypothetical protein
MKLHNRIKIWIVWNVFHRVVGWLMCRWLELRVRLLGKTFHCSALSGDSNYNTSINADLTISCTCQDRDGAGRIGDLKTHTFEQIWYGPKANEFRESMTRGRLPLLWCSHGADRQEVARD